MGTDNPLFFFGDFSRFERSKNPYLTIMIRYILRLISMWQEYKLNNKGLRVSKWNKGCESKY